MKMKFEFAKTPSPIPNAGWLPEVTEEGWHKVKLFSGNAQIDSGFGPFPTEYMLLSVMRANGYFPKNMPPSWSALAPLRDLTTKVAANLLGVAAQKISRACAAGKISPSHVGEQGKWIIDTEMSMLSFIQNEQGIKVPNKKKANHTLCAKCGNETRPNGVGKRNEVVCCNPECRYISFRK